MPRYKRTADEAQLDIPLEPEVAPESVETRDRLRNMWEFAALMQFIQTFGDALKIDKEVDIEYLEAECLRPEPSEKLAEMGLKLLKHVSSHRGLTPEIFDEYTRRQYLAKAPQRNPFGDEEDPAKFHDLDIFTRVRILQQLTVWTFGNASRMRELMGEEDHLSWRVEPLGWDKEDRTYYLLDDNRLYRRTDVQPPPPSPPLKPKAKSKATPKKGRSRGTRASKRRKVEETSEDEVEDEKVEDVKPEEDLDGDTKMTNGASKPEDDEPAFGFTDKTWECVAVTLEDYNQFLATIFRTRDANERHLRKQIEEEVLPRLEERAEQLRQQHLKKLREIELQEKTLTAKRSGRLAAKQEQERQEREIREAEERKQAALRMAHAEAEKQRRDMEGYESRRQTREQRAKEREVKRILLQEDMDRMEAAASRAESQDPSSEAPEGDTVKRISERQLKTERERHKLELEKLAAEEDNWVFDCLGCGVRGDNLDDGTHSVACERCNVWQHSECHNITPQQAEDPNFHFICKVCKQKEEDAKKPKIAPLKLGKNRLSSSPDEKKRSISRPTSSTSAAESSAKANLPEHITRQLDGVHVPPYNPQYRPQPPGPFGPAMNGSMPYAQPPPGSVRHPPVGNFAPRPQHFSQPQQPWHGSPLPPPQRPISSGYGSSPPPSNMLNGHGSPPQHQTQHQAMHQNAIASSGAHPAYQLPAAPYPPAQMNGFNPRAPGGVYPAGPEAAPQYHSYSNQQMHYNTQAPHQQQHPAQRSGSQGQLLNGYASPVKGAAQPAGPAAPQHQRQLSQGQQYPASSPQSTLQHPSSLMPRSPNANFPPQPAYPHQSAHSPIKSSPQQAPVQQAGYQHRSPVVQPLRTPNAPQIGRPPSSNGAAPTTQQHHTPAASGARGHPSVAQDGMSGPWPGNSKAIPQKHDQAAAPPPAQQTPVATQHRTPQYGPAMQPSPAGSNANTVAADGMSGPWPESAKVIPQKQDRSPPQVPQPSTLMPSSSQAELGKKAIVPPVSLSPSQQTPTQMTGQGQAGLPVKQTPLETASATADGQKLEVNGHVSS